MNNKNDLEKKDKLFFDKISEVYSSKDFIKDTKIYRNFINKFVFDQFLDNNQSTLNFLEVGCGIGSTSQLLNKYNINYTGIDYSEKLIKIAKQNFQSSRINFECINVKDYNSNNLIDIIFMNGALHHMTDIDLVIRKFREILKENGTIVAIEPLDNNLFFKFLRNLRKKIDKNYSSDQFFFDYKLIEKIFSKHNIQYKLIPFGFFTPPLAQIKLPLNLNIFFYKLFTFIDIFIYKYFPQFIQKYSWNVIIKLEFTK